MAHQFRAIRCFLIGVSIYSPMNEGALRFGCSLQRVETYESPGGYLLVRGRSPVSLLQGIAGGLLGMSCFEGRLATAAPGVSFHF